MRTFIPKGVDAIATDDEFANLENYSRRRGHFQYSFRVRIDQIRFLKLHATKLRITLKHESSEGKKSLFGEHGVLSPREVIDALLVDRPTKKDDIRSKKKNVILQRQMDVTSRVNNDIARYIHSFSEEDAETLLPEIFTYEFKTVAELKRARTQTSYNNVVFREEDYSDVESLDVSTMSYEAVNKLGKDPAMLVMSREKIVTQDNALFGTIPSKKTEKDRFTNKVIRTIKKDVTVIENNQTLDSLSDSELLPVRVKRYKRYITIKRRFRLTNSQLRNQSTFNVVLELLDRHGAVVQRETVTVNHRKLLEDYFIPRKAPTIRVASQTLGTNIIEVSQRDKSATAVRVYKRVINDSAPLINSPFELVGHFRLRKRGRKKGNRFLRIKDSTPNSNPVIYRAVPVRNKKGYPIFKSVVAPAVNLPKEFIVTKNKFSTMALASNEQGVQIEIRKFDSNASFMSIWRKDLTAREKNFRRLSKEFIGTDSGYTRITNKTMTFVDGSVQDGREYEYRTSLMYKDGTEIILIGGTFIEYMKPTDEVTFQVSKPRIVRGRKNANCTFNITTSLENDDGNTNQTELLKDFLKSSGTESMYMSPEQLQELRDDSRKIIVFSIERINLTTGDRSLFNIFNPQAGTKFNDKRLSRQSKIPKLSAGNRYRYIVTAHKVSPSDLLKDAGIVKIDKRTGMNYKRNTAKMSSRRALKTGTILPTKSRYRVTGRNSIFNLGKTGSTRIIDADLTGVLPEIVSANVEMISRRENVLTWSVRGDTSKFDHFIIMIEKINSTIPVFVAQAIPNKLNYDYVDTFTPKIRGPIEFKIVPVYIDYTRGDEEEMGAIISSGIAAKRARQRK